jgi:hypothetical protein
MAELETMIEQASAEVQQHTEAMLRQRMAALLSPEAQRVLDLHIEAQHEALVIGCLGVPCWLEREPDGASVWQFGCPWWRSLIPEDGMFEVRVLAEVGKVKLHIDGMLEKLDPAKLN